MLQEKPSEGVEAPAASAEGMAAASLESKCPCPQCVNHHCPDRTGKDHQEAFLSRGIGFTVDLFSVTSVAIYF